jgi:hypothetical protein
VAPDMMPAVPGPTRINSHLLSWVALFSADTIDKTGPVSSVRIYTEVSKYAQVHAFSATELKNLKVAPGKSQLLH